MRREDPSDLAVSLAVAEERSFARAAARLGTSRSAIGQIVRRLEARMGLKLLTRTIRSVSPTAGGEQSIETLPVETLRPAFEEIDARLSALSALRERPPGTVRITTSRAADRDGGGIGIGPGHRDQARRSRRPAGWCASSRAGARPSPGIISTTPIGGNCRRHSSCWWTR